MIEPEDMFGRRMVDNLRDRGCELLGIFDCPSLQSQHDRMQKSLEEAKKEDQSVHVEAITMEQLYREKLNPQEKVRIERIEMFDEFEEWTLLQAHYCLVFGKKFKSDFPIDKVTI
uniref:Uncharacterized protein n=1 Tax=Strombidium rassoulzadegani TaxID=1082188 RepID=A0A7S3CU96_9SPIT